MLVTEELGGFVVVVVEEVLGAGVVVVVLVLSTVSGKCNDYQRSI